MLSGVMDFFVKDPSSYLVDTELTRKIKKHSFFRSKHFILRPTLKGFDRRANGLQRKKILFLFRESIQWRLISINEEGVKPRTFEAPHYEAQNCQTSNQIN
jgi:hypothetical protein